MARRNGPRAPKTDAPEHVRAVKMELRALGVAEREVRKRWYELRTAAKHTAENFPETYAAAAREHWRASIGAVTMELWAAEDARLEAAARWRLILAQREAMPVADRWNLADLEAWAAWSPGVL